MESLKQSKLQHIFTIHSLVWQINDLEERCADYGKKPAIFYNMFGHTCEVIVEVFLHGWEKETPPDASFCLCFSDELYDEERVIMAEEYLIKLANKAGVPYV